MQQLELTPQETIILYGFIAGTLETMRERGISNLSHPELTVSIMESIVSKLGVILNNVAPNN